MIRLNLRLDYLGAEGLPVGTVRHDPGVPPELEALAVRVCREVYHDNEAAVSRMIDDLKAIPVKHHAKMGEHFRALLAAKVQGSSLVTCGACSHQSSGYRAVWRG